MPSEFHVAIIDDDQAALDGVRLFFTRHKAQVTCFDRSTDFLTAIKPAEQFDCIVYNIGMPGVSGLALLRRLGQLKYKKPIIMMTEHADIPMAVTAIKKGAFDIVNKPLDPRRLFASVLKAVKATKQDGERAAELNCLQSRFNALSSRQRQVMEFVVAGLSNKETGLRLNISPKTVDHHRAWVMERMGAKNLPDLVRLALRIQGNMI